MAKNYYRRFILSFPTEEDWESTERNYRFRKVTTDDPKREVQFDVDKSSVPIKVTITFLKGSASLNTFINLQPSLAFRILEPKLQSQDERIKEEPQLDFTKELVRRNSDMIFGSEATSLITETNEVHSEAVNKMETEDFDHNEMESDNEDSYDEILKDIKELKTRQQRLRKLKKGLENKLDMLPNGVNGKVALPKKKDEAKQMELFREFYRAVRAHIPANMSSELLLKVQKKLGVGLSPPQSNSPVFDHIEKNESLKQSKLIKEQQEVFGKFYKAVHPIIPDLVPEELHMKALTTFKLELLDQTRDEKDPPLKLQNSSIQSNKNNEKY